MTWMLSGQCDSATFNGASELRLGLIFVPTFCLVDVPSPQIVKRVLVACANVNACVFKYAATSGLPHLWEDYCHRIKNVILRMGMFLVVCVRFTKFVVRI